MEVKFSKLSLLLFSAFCCAIICVLSKFAVFIGPIPITLGNLGVYLSGGLLGAKFGGLSVLLYLILVLVGMPFTAGKTGLAVFFGYSGGYLVGYFFMALVVGFFYKSFKSASEKLTSFKVSIMLFVSCVFGTVVCYGFGLIWYIILTKCGFLQALVSCVLPFLIGDFLKICIVSLIVPKLERVLFKKD